MKRLPLVFAGALLVGAAAFPPLEDALRSIRAEQIRAHTWFLSHDLMRGRAPGTPGGQTAAMYIGSRFLALGVEPVQGSYFQDVPIVGVTPRPARVGLAFDAGAARDAGAEASAGAAAAPVAGYPRDFVLWPGRADTAAAVSGELVFVGYGVRAPEYDWDDFGDTDLSGKILLVLVNDPPAPPEEPGLFEGRAMTYYGRWTYKLEQARRQGAAGALIVHTDDAAGYPWTVVRNSFTGEQFALADESREGMQVEGWVTEALAREVLASGGLELSELMVRAARRDFLPVETGITVSASAPAQVRHLRSPNVVGIVPGSDPARSDELVVITAHYDHLGVGTGGAAAESVRVSAPGGDLGVAAGADIDAADAPGQDGPPSAADAPAEHGEDALAGAPGQPPAGSGDSIFNGAYDNASGVAVLLEIAQAFALARPRPARSVLFIATTAEEAGLLGSEYYVRHPLLPLEQTAAVINIDGANVWGETDDVVGLGIDRSTLGTVLERAAGEMGLELIGDRAPEKGFYFRSDHFPFARAGVPALYIEHGTDFRGRPEDWGEAVLGQYESERYHQPGDEYDPAFDFSGAVQQARLALRVVWAVADDAERPRLLE